MAGRFAEGFDALASATVASRFTTMHASNTVVAAGRNGGNCLRVGNWQRIFEVALAAKATWTVGFALRMTTTLPNAEREVVALWDSSTRHVNVTIGTDGVLRVYRHATLLATGTSALSPDTFYYLELQAVIDDSAGVVRLQVNGVAESLTFVSGTETTQDTRNAGNASANVIRFCDADNSSTAGAPDFDDIYILDGDVADADNPNDDFLGDVRVEALLPGGAGDDADFTPSAGSNYENVDDATPDGDTTYNSSSTTNHDDTFAMGNLASTGSVAFIDLCHYARKEDAGSALIAGLIKPGTTMYAGDDRAPSVTYRYVSNIWDVNPDTGIAFTSSDVNAMKAGYRKSG